MASGFLSRDDDLSEKNHDKPECSSDKGRSPMLVASELQEMGIGKKLDAEPTSEDQPTAKAEPKKPVPLYPMSIAPPSKSDGLMCFPNEEPIVPQPNNAMRLSMSQYVGAMTAFPGLPTPGLCLSGNREGIESFLQTTPFLKQQQSSQDNANTFIPHFVFSPRHPMGKKYFRCPQCRYYTDRKNNLKRHIGTMHQDCGKVLECCDIVFRSKAALRDHILLFHRTGYRCKHCGRNFCRKALLKRHLTVHSGQKEYYCDSCEYGTSHQAHMDQHVRGHVSKPAFESEEEEATESRMGILQAAQHDQFNMWYLASGFRDPVTLFPYQRTGSLFPQHMFSLPDRLKLTHSATASSSFTPVIPPNKIDSTDNLSGNDEVQSQGTPSSSLENRKLEDKIGGALPDSHSYLNHNKRRIFKRPYKCSDCTITFPNQQRFREHAKGCKKLEVVEPQRPLRYLVDKPTPSTPEDNDEHLVNGDEPLCLVKTEDCQVKINEEKYETDSPQPVKMAFNVPLNLASEEDTESQTSEVEGHFFNHYFPFPFPPYRPLEFSPVLRPEPFPGFRPYDRVEAVGSPALGRPLSTEGSPRGHSPLSHRPTLGERDTPEGNQGQPGDTGSSLPLKKRLVHS